MSKWEVITEVKDTGYYIGWQRDHKMIHMPEPMEPMSKTSLVHIGGRDGCYQVRGLTFAHSVFEQHRPGLRLFDKTYIYQTMTESQVKATELKKTIAKLFDGITRSDSNGNLVLRNNIVEATNENNQES